MSAKDEINDKADPIADEEKLTRLLCSPLYYNKELGIVNIDTFDLRMVGKNKDVPETYVSLGRCGFINTPELIENYIQFASNHIKWPQSNPKNKFTAFANFLCQKAKEINDIIEIHPLVGNDPKHIGLFYRKKDSTYYEGPLPKTDPEILEILMDLTSIVEVEEVDKQK